MVPQRVLPLDALPLTVNGKLDRKALEERARQDDAARRRPATPRRSRRSIGIFADALPGTAVDADTDFFVAGGDSIIAIGVVNRARALGLTLTPRDLFLHKTPRALSRRTRGPPVRA